MQLAWLYQEWLLEEYIAIQQLYLQKCKKSRIALLRGIWDVAVHWGVASRQTDATCKAIHISGLKF